MTDDARVGAAPHKSRSYVDDLRERLKADREYAGHYLEACAGDSLDVFLLGLADVLDVYDLPRIAALREQVTRLTDRIESANRAMRVMMGEHSERQKERDSAREQVARLEQQLHDAEVDAVTKVNKELVRLEREREEWRNKALDIDNQRIRAQQTCDAISASRDALATRCRELVALVMEITDTTILLDPQPGYKRIAKALNEFDATHPGMLVRDAAMKGAKP